jgi:uncharacterized protein with ParB-like and HNH nuclease domain
MSELKNSLTAIQNKAKERTVKTQTIEYDLETLVKKIKKNIIKLNPEYQRKHRWTDEFSSRLIESLILNIPIPIIYLSQDVDVDDEVDDGISRYSVIDGQQRLTAINNFFENNFSLVGLDVLKELNGSFYRDLPPFLIRRLEERTIRCLRIDSTIDPQVKYDIFERLNSGSVKLEAQELRNATCRGPFKELIKKLAKTDDFVEIAKLKPKSARVKKMEDEELVLRFFAMTSGKGYRDYKGNFKQFLTKKMEEFNLIENQEELTKMSKNFTATMRKIRKYYGDAPFVKYRYKDNEFKKMSPFNAAVFDAVVYPFSKLKKAKTPSYKKFKKLFADPDFFASVEGSVNDVTKIETRISKTSSVI